MSKLVELSWVTRLNKNLTAIKELSKEYTVSVDELKLNPNIVRYSYQLDGNIPEELLNEIIRHIKEIEYLPLIIPLGRQYDNDIYNQHLGIILKKVLSDTYGVPIDYAGIQTITDSEESDKSTINFVPIRNNWKLYFPVNLMIKLNVFNFADYYGYTLLSDDPLIDYAVSTYPISPDVLLNNFKKIGNCYLISVNMADKIEELNDYVRSLRRQGYIVIDSKDDKYKISPEVAKLWDGEIMLINDGAVIKNNCDFYMDAKTWYLQTIDRLLSGDVPRMLIPLHLPMEDDELRLIYLGYLMNKQMGKYPTRGKVEIINNHLAIGNFISYKDYGDFINELADILTVLGDKMLNFWYQEVDTVEEANSITPDGYYSVGEYQMGPTTLTASYDLPQTQDTEGIFENISDLINLTLSLVSNNKEEAYIIEIKANMEDIFTPDNYIPISFISPYGTRTSRYQKEEMSLTLFESEENVTNQVPVLRELMNILYDGYTTGKWLDPWSKYIYLNYKKVSRLLFLLQ